MRPQTYQRPFEFLRDSDAASGIPVTIRIHATSGVIRNTKAAFVPGGLSSPL